MEKPKYGKINQSSENIADKFRKTNSDDKSLDIQAETFNWDEEEVKSPEKINLGQYEDENYDEDFEDEVKSNDSTPKKSTKKFSPKKSEPRVDKKNNFTKEEEEILDQYQLPEDIPEEDQKKPEEENNELTTMQLQVKEINDLIEQATNICLK